MLWVTDWLFCMEFISYLRFGARIKFLVHSAKSWISLNGFNFVMQTLTSPTPSSLHVGMAAQWDEGGGRVVQDINTDSGMIMLQPIRFQCIGVSVSAGLPCIHIRSWPHVYWVLADAKFDLKAYDEPLSDCVKSWGMCSVLLLLVTAFAGTHKQIGFHNFTYMLGGSFKLCNFFLTDSTLQNTVVDSLHCSRS